MIFFWSLVQNSVVLTVCFLFADTCFLLYISIYILLTVHKLKIKL